MPLFKLSILIAFSIVWGTSHTALAPNHNADRKLQEMHYSQKARERASDVITLHVDEVEMGAEAGDGCPQRDNYTVDATVENVERGNLKKGDKIRIDYLRMYYQCPGPQTRNPPVLKSGQRHDAYLKCKGKRCQLSAGAWSFLGEADFKATYMAARQEQEYYEELYSDIQRTFYTEREGKGEALEMSRRDGTWMPTTCWKNQECMAYKAYKAELITIDSPLPDSHGGLAGDSITLSCELTQAQSVILYRPQRDPVEFCRFADGSLTNLRMLKYHFREYRVSRLYDEIAPSQCLRVKAESPPQKGMAGYRGPLNNTLTLSCLNYIGSEKQGDETFFKLRDESGKTYHVKWGDYVGERSGIVRELYGDKSLEIIQTLYFDEVTSKSVYVHLPITH